MRYSLSRYILTVQLPEAFPTSFVQAFGQSLSIGGEGSMIGTISLEHANPIWETEGDVTGGYVHSQSLDMHGTCVVTIKQVADAVVKFIRLCNCFFTSKLNFKEGLYLELKDNDGNIVATCKDCYIERIPRQEFASKAGDQDWTFTCGKITFAAPVI